MAWDFDGSEKYVGKENNFVMDYSVRFWVLYY